MFIDITMFIVLTICLYTDLTKRRIFNVVILPAIIITFIFYLVSDGLPKGWWSLQGLVLGIALLVIPFSMGGIGAGDVKLLGVIGALKGPDFVFNVFLASAIAGGVISIIQLIRHKKLFSTLKRFALNLYFYIMGLPRLKEQSTVLTAKKEDMIPYGAAIAAGTIAAYIVR